MRRYLQLVLLFCCTLTVAPQAQSSICNNPGLDIPQAECQALLGLYASMNGDTWFDNSNWGTSTTTGEWYGVSVWGGHVRGIYLYGSGLQGDFAITQGNLDFLDTIWLYSNQITGFDTTGLSSLQSLDLGWNQLVSFDGAGLTNLQTLYLNDNDLTLFDGAGLTNLTNLYLYNNRLSSFNGSLFPRLQTLDISSNQLPVFNGSQLGDLVSLDIRNNKLTAFSGEGLTNLDTLYASNNQISSISNEDQLSSIWYVGVSNNKLISVPPTVSSWLDQYAESDWAQTQTTITIPSGDTPSPDTTVPSTTIPSSDSNPPSVSGDTSDTSPPSVSGGTSDTSPPSVTVPPSDTDPSTTTKDAECAATHFGCIEGASEQKVTTDTEWTWKCYVAGNPDGMASCSEKRPGECGQNKNTCNRGDLIDHDDTATEYKWECYVGGTDPAWCSKPIPKCGATKFACSGGTLGVQLTLPSVYTWTCTNGEESVSCQLDRPECGVQKNTCIKGAVGNQLIDNTFAPKERSYLWKCALNNESKDCRTTIPLCDGKEYDPDTQKCCEYDPADPNLNDHQGVFGAEQLLCPKDWKCFNRTVCSDPFGVVNGEDGGADVTCTAQVRCMPPSTIGVANLCDSSRPNNNCQDECLTGALPPEWCPPGGGTTGSCGVVGTCTSGVPFGHPPIWWCLGSDGSSSTDDVMCGGGGTGIGECSGECGKCITGTPVSTGTNSWICRGGNNASTSDDVNCTCTGDVTGECSESGCTVGTKSAVMDGNIWMCYGSNPSSTSDDVMCSMKRAKCSNSGCLIGIKSPVMDGNIWMCYGNNPNSTDDDVMCRWGITYGECSSGGCISGTKSSVMDGNIWWCYGSDATSVADDAFCHGIGCQGIAPKNANLCAGDDTGLTSNITRSLVASCGGAKCEYICSGGYVKIGSSCVPVANGSCSNPLIKNTCGPGSSVSNIRTSLTQFLWDCNGTNGGTTDFCSLNRSDLTAAAPTPSTATINTAQTFTVTISNANSPTEMGFNNFFQITNVSGYVPPVVNPDLTKITDKPSTGMAALVAGGTATATTSHTFTVEGIYYVRACADKTNRASPGAIAESDENNNCGAWTAVTVSSDGSCSGSSIKNTCATGYFADSPDSATQFLWRCDGMNGGATAFCALNKPNLTAAAPTPNTATAGVARTFNATISNVNGPTGGSFNNFFQISTGSGMTGTVINKSATSMGALVAGATATTTTSHTFTAAGPYYIRVCADKSTAVDTGTITESNEGDNCGPETEITVGAVGVCGTKARAYSYDTTDWPVGSNYCDLGSPSTSPAFPVTRGTSVTWQCNNNGSLSPICTATLSVQPICGNYASIFQASDTGFPTQGTTYCAAGTPDASPSFPNNGASISWNCLTGSGASSVGCTATRHGSCDATTLPGGQTPCNAIFPATDNASYVKVVACDGITACTYKEDVCDTTIIPNEIRTSSGKPLIQCTDTTKGSFFRYRITKPDNSTTDSTNSYTVTTSAVHPTIFDTGEYQIQCAYGAASQTFDQMAKGCSKTMIVVPDATTPVCELMNVYDANKTQIEPITDASVMNFASSAKLRFQCRSDASIGDGQQFGFSSGSHTSIMAPGLPQFLDILDFMNYLSEQTGDIDFTNPSTTPVSCFVPAGLTGYSTSDACQKTICVGDACVSTEKYIFTPARLCTRDANTSYVVTCKNPSDPTCTSSLVTGNMSFKINNIGQSIPLSCAGSVCTVSIQSGQKIEVEVKSGIYQTIQGAVLDNVAPTVATEYFTEYNPIANNGNNVTQNVVDEKWFNTQVAIRVQCDNTVSVANKASNSDGICACAASPNLETITWGNIPLNTQSFNQKFFHYTTDTTFSSRTVTMADTSQSPINPVNGDKGLESSAQIKQIKIDTKAPVLKSAIESTNFLGSPIVTFIFSEGEGESGFSIPPATQVVTKGSQQFYTDKCGVLTFTPGFGPALGPSGQNATRVRTFNPLDSTKEIHYCVYDNAGNTTTGIYPTTFGNACFSDESSNVNLNTYDHGVNDSYGLIERISGVKANPSIGQLAIPSNRGYILTDKNRALQIKTFNTKLAGNINKYIINRYCPTELSEDTRSLTISSTKPFNDGAGNKLLSKTCEESLNIQTPNTNGYYYFTPANGVTLLTLAPTSVQKIVKPTVVYAKGADIYIKNNIKYDADSGLYPSLVIISQKEGNTGGNIYVDPGVTLIDATLIADGALMNWDGLSYYPPPLDGIIQPLFWITDARRQSPKVPLLSKRLVINGRLLTRNTRGGSLGTDGTTFTALEGSGTQPIDLNKGWCVNAKTLEPYLCNWQDAAAQDLERFRSVSDTEKTTNPQCTLHVTNNIPQRRPDILTTILD